MKSFALAALVMVFMSVTPGQKLMAEDTGKPEAMQYQVIPIGWVRKSAGKTTLEINAEYQDALLGVDELESIWVIWWFDRNDTPEKRSILQVNPFGDPNNPLRGVFATRAPVRPNLVALTRCRVLSVKGNIIEIDDIDAFADTPILDIKRYVEGW